MFVETIIVAFSYALTFGKKIHLSRKRSVINEMNKSFFDKRYQAANIKIKVRVNYTRILIEIKCLFY